MTRKLVFSRAYSKKATGIKKVIYPFSWKVNQSSGEYGVMFFNSFSVYIEYRP